MHDGKDKEVALEKGYLFFIGDESQIPLQAVPAHGGGWGWGVCISTVFLHAIDRCDVGRNLVFAFGVRVNN
jgi:hypothetical protein